jgi:hypothetical protein
LATERYSGRNEWSSKCWLRAIAAKLALRSASSVSIFNIAGYAAALAVAGA